MKTFFSKNSQHLLVVANWRKIVHKYNTVQFMSFRTNNTTLPLFLNWIVPAFPFCVLQKETRVLSYSETEWVNKLDQKKMRGGGQTAATQKLRTWIRVPLWTRPPSRPAQAQQQSPTRVISSQKEKGPISTPTPGSQLSSCTDELPSVSAARSSVHLQSFRQSTTSMSETRL